MELNKVCWIGGAARSGKSSIASRFAANESIQVYHTDDYFGAIMMKKFIVAEEEYPHLFIVQNEDEHFIVRKPIDEYINFVMGIHNEIFKMVTKDIINLTTSNAVIVEGLSLLPDFLYSSGITNALFLASSQVFFKEKAEYRDKLQTQADSTTLNDNINAMMVTLRTHIEEKAVEYGYKVIPVDDEHTLDVNIGLVADCFSLQIP